MYQNVYISIPMQSDLVIQWNYAWIPMPHQSYHQPCYKSFRWAVPNQAYSSSIYYSLFNILMIFRLLLCQHELRIVPHIPKSQVIYRKLFILKSKCQTSAKAQLTVWLIKNESHNFRAEALMVTPIKGWLTYIV